MGLADSPLSSGFCALGNGFHITSSLVPCIPLFFFCAPGLLWAGLFTIVVGELDLRKPGLVEDSGWFRLWRRI